MCLLCLVYYAYAFTGYTAYIWLILSVYSYFMISLVIALHKIIWKSNYLSWKYKIQHYFQQVERITSYWLACVCKVDFVRDLLIYFKPYKFAPSLTLCMFLTTIARPVTNLQSILVLHWLHLPNLGRHWSRSSITLFFYFQ